MRRDPKEGREPYGEKEDMFQAEGTAEGMKRPEELELGG